MMVMFNKARSRRRAAAVENLPYGAFLQDDVVVLHDRKYRPIVWCRGTGPVVLTVPAWTRDRKRITLMLRPNEVIACAPNVWVEHTSHVWFYDDGSSPRHNRETRERLETLVNAIPAMAAVISLRG
jgi:hypothetical protein